MQDGPGGEEVEQDAARLDAALARLVVVEGGPHLRAPQFIDGTGPCRALRRAGEHPEVPSSVAAIVGGVYAAELDHWLAIAEGIPSQGPLADGTPSLELGIAAVVAVSGFHGLGVKLDAARRMLALQPDPASLWRQTASGRSATASTSPARR